MKLLAFDTSTPACTVAICNNNNILQAHHKIPMQHGKVLLPIIQSLLNEAELSLDQLDAIIYGAGPGSYTGIRIASSACQAIAYAINKPVIRISSLQALAQSALQNQSVQKLFVLQDARMGQFYFASYSVQCEVMQAELKDSLFTMTELEQYANTHVIPRGSLRYGVGDGWSVIGESLIEKLIGVKSNYDSTLTPSAAALIELGKIEYRAGRILRPEEAQPIYLR